jgi:hypothetical protein
MAELTDQLNAPEVVIGQDNQGFDIVMRTFEINPAAQSATEWIATGWRSVLGIMGWTQHGANPLAPIAATGIITCLVADPVDNDTISIGDGTNTMVYKVETTPADRGDVDLNATIATFGASLTAAINGLVEGSTSTFDPFTASNPWVTATFADPDITITAIVPGSIGNSYTLAQVGDTVSVSAATLTGGHNSGVNFIMNEQGSGGVAGDLPGNIGVEASSTGGVVQVTAYGVTRHKGRRLR